VLLGQRPEDDVAAGGVAERTEHPVELLFVN
jgi:hypothetical protein